MHFDILTLFPHIITPYIQESMIQRAVANGIISVAAHNLRDWATDKHHVTDDTPFAGGGGMVMKVEPVFAAVNVLRREDEASRVILMSPQGQRLDHARAQAFAQERHLIILCGRYEGVDERIREHLVTDEISIGDYVLSGGELPALVLIESVMRLLPGALGAPNGASEDSFANGLLEYPHYTRPAIFRGWEVPEVLLTGNHQLVKRWRRKQSWLRTLIRRPDLAAMMKPTKSDIELLKEIRAQADPELCDLINTILRGEE
jgi:tRNA (guanine37-N1)-methyltransferase